MNTLNRMKPICDLYLLKRLLNSLVILAVTIYCPIAFSATTITDSASALAVPTNKTANAVFVQKTGILANPEVAGTLDTGTTCPAGFTGYGTITPVEIAAASGSNAMTEFVVCAQSTSPTGSAISYTSNIGYIQFTNVSHPDRWAGTNPDAFTIFDSTPMPDTSYMASTTTSTSAKKIAWTLYCYPASIPVPTTSCP